MRRADAVLAITRWFGAGLVATILLGVASGATWAEERAVVRGLDHVPTAVRNLYSAIVDFRALGFVLKPGRPHANGIRNAHAKFPDGTEVELITVVAAVDPLSSFYVEWLRQAEGPALLGLYAPDRDALAAHLARFGLSLGWRDGLGVIREQGSPQGLFFAGRQTSPTDRAEHFAHPNTALRLAGAWLVEDPAVMGLLREVGGETGHEAPCGPLPRATSTVSFPEGVIAGLPAHAAIIPGRPIVAVVVEVRDLVHTRAVLGASGIRSRAEPACQGDSVWIDPSKAHGVWIQFRQVR